MAEEKGLQSLVNPRSRTVRGEEERMLEAQRLRKEQLESLYNMERPNIDYAQIAEDAYEGIKAMDTADQIALGIEGMLLCEMPVERHRSMKEYYSSKNGEQNESVAGDLDALGRRNGLPIQQERRSETSRGRNLSAMSD